MAKNKYLKSTIYLFIIIGLICSTLLVITLSNQSCSIRKKVKTTPIAIDDLNIEASAEITTSDQLNDKNDLHLLHAQTNGLRTIFESDEQFELQIDSLIQRSVLIKVGDTKFYKLKNLTHSQPYLIPEGVDMLNDIGSRFQKKLKERKYKDFKFRITSLLRTKETQNKLSRRNSNATEHSAHLYGTTVDISYKNFINTKNDSIESSYEAIQALTKVLIEMREECKILVVRERKQACFHITVVIWKLNKN